MPRDPRFNSVDDAVETTSEKENKTGFDSLTDWEKNINLIWHASGLIGNGGLRYFFEQSGNAEASAQAYVDVGMRECADILRTAASLIPANLNDEELLSVLEEKSDLLHDLSVAYWKNDSLVVEKLHDYICVQRG